MDPRFTDEDRALLEELEDEALALALFARQAGPTASIPRRASVLIAGMRALEGGTDSVASAGQPNGDVSALFPLLLVEDLVKRPPEVVHGMAVYFDRLAKSYESAFERAGEPDGNLRDSYLRARTRSLAAFIALVSERVYLSEYGRRVAGSALSNEQAGAAALAVAEECLDDLGATAQRGARELTATSALALAALAMTPEACRVAGVDDITTKRFSRRAESVRATAIDEALAVVEGNLAEARSRGIELSRLVAAFERVRDIWHWSGRDESVERFAVDEVTGSAWIVYRTQKWDDLRALLAPCVDLYESLARRIEGDPKRHLAYSAKCAQIFVFRSDAELDKRAEWTLAERAVALCPTHRNGRSTLAYLLANRAVSRLGSTWFPSAADIDAARADIARADELFPQSTRLGAAKEKLKEVTDKLHARS